MSNWVVRAGSKGGHVYVSSSSVVLNTSVLHQSFDSLAANEGGAVFATATPDDADTTGLQLIESSISGARAAVGGAMYARFTTVLISQSSVAAGFATSFGGCLYIEVGRRCLPAIRCVFTLCPIVLQASRNTRVESSVFTHCAAVYDGGSMFLLETQAMVTDVSLMHNQADLGAGVFVDSFSVLTATTSVFHSNEARFSGGGVHVNRLGSLHLIDCIVNGACHMDAPLLARACSLCAPCHRQHSALRWWWSVAN